MRADISWRLEKVGAPHLGGRARTGVKTGGYPTSRSKRILRRIGFVPPQHRLETKPWSVSIRMDVASGYDELYVHKCAHRSGKPLDEEGILQRQRGGGRTSPLKGKASKAWEREWHSGLASPKRRKKEPAMQWTEESRVRGNRTEVRRTSLIRNANL